MSKRGEFGFIDYIKANFPTQEGAIGIGDDCAVMPAGGGELLISTDLLMEGVHFLRNESSPELVSVCAEQGWDRYELSTSGGEDFELLFTGSDGLENELDIKIYPVGKIVDGNELTWTVEGSAVDYDYMGYKHF